MNRLSVVYTPHFAQQIRAVEPQLQEETIEKIELLKDPKNHKQLKVHKLKGYFYGRYSFSVNYKIRIVFSYLSKKEVVLLALGDHDIYK